MAWISYPFYTLALAAADPGADALAFWEIDWGDGFVLTITGDQTQATHVYTTAGNWNITVRAGDEDGEYPAPQSIQVESVASAARAVKFTAEQGASQDSGLTKALERVKRTDPATSTQALASSNRLSGLALPSCPERNQRRVARDLCKRLRPPGRKGRGVVMRSRCFYSRRRQ
ncbi:PKD domain-containing protein [Thiorhodovibrio frisius]|uniref:PKD domain-containing protein n=1 Tax=Thiorhodovibrio frisius TaxID=631362 RepID=H8YWZ0_9GAMM|nr:PKD domain-containing protein [Thiorhodovibrio frisius]EIC22966.1 hypothetical protein Thi970DRAFT_00612 [Thiorhodovibrio frisius]WPL22772.1 hypothetical protein Thiofri_02942 [Thiorhodovibrio frisius]